MPLPEADDIPGASRHRWRDVYRNDILPKLAAFNPDIIMVSAGFDAHKKDTINFGYIGLLEEDYEWVTQQLVQVRGGGFVPLYKAPAASYVDALLPLPRKWLPTTYSLTRGRGARTTCRYL